MGKKFTLSVDGAELAKADIKMRYDKYNKMYFEGKLVKPQLATYWGESTMGIFNVSERHGKVRRKILIARNVRYTQENLRDVLIHEMIHLYQARDCHDSWLLFYLRYGWYWLLANRYRRRLKNAGYRLNPFEMEAYANMYDLHYLDDKPHGVAGWRRYARMSLDERMKHL